jgi:glutaconyl-CoA/methylmalonyl-CoA decarboxylase subunit gamma
MKKLRVTVDGKIYEVLVEMMDEPAAAVPPRPAPPRPEAPPPPRVSAPPASAPAAAAGDITSPLAGKVVSVDVAVGQAVAVGAQVATIEAMKMNTFVYAEAAGTVAAVLAQPGDSVEEGAPLVRLG